MTTKKQKVQGGVRGALATFQAKQRALGLDGLFDLFFPMCFVPEAASPFEIDCDRFSGDPPSTVAQGEC